MMSDERRYWFVIDKGKLEYVQDNVTNEKITVSELEDLLNEQQDTISRLEEENKRLDIRKYNRKVKMQDHIIDTQQDIINAFCELVGMINDKE